MTGVVTRLIGVLLLGASASVLGVAGWLEPAERGVGTHRQLGMQACGMLAATGVPCVGCGMTTATALAVRGRFVAAAWTQPAGLGFAFLAATGLYLGGWMSLTAADPRPALRWLQTRRFAWWATAAVLLAWAWTAVRLRWLS